MTAHRRNQYLQKKYGITLSDYNEMLEAQGGVCAICHKPPKKDKNLAVDHNHLFGYVRGLLCYRCNHMLLGYFHEDAALLFSAALYLDRTNQPQNKFLEEAHNDNYKYTRK